MINYTNIFTPSSEKHYYVLMNKDTPLVEFSIKDISAELFTINDISYLTDNFHLDSAEFRRKRLNWILSFP